MKLRALIAQTGVVCVLASSGLCQQAPRPAAQRAPTAYYEDTNNVPVSAEVHSDR